MAQRIVTNYPFMHVGFGGGYVSCWKVQLYFNRPVLIGIPSASTQGQAEVPEELRRETPKEGGCTRQWTTAIKANDSHQTLPQGSISADTFSDGGSGSCY